MTGSEERRPLGGGPLGQPYESGAPAGAVMRLFPYMVDGLISSALYRAAGIGPDGWVERAIAAVAVLGYFVLLEGWFGRTVGKMLSGIKVTMADGTPCTPRAALMRRVWFVLPAALPPAVGGSVVGTLTLIGLVTVALDDPLRRGFHDRLASTRVVVA